MILRVIDIVLGKLLMLVTYNLVNNSKGDSCSSGDVTDYLVSAAEEYNGDFDGWETKVIKEQESLSPNVWAVFLWSEINNQG
jgi:hypothetical protein